MFSNKNDKIIWEKIAMHPWESCDKNSLEIIILYHFTLHMLGKIIFLKEVSANFAYLCSKVH